MTSGSLCGETKRMRVKCPYALYGLHFNSVMSFSLTLISFMMRVQSVHVCLPTDIPVLYNMHSTAVFTLCVICFH